MAIISIRNWPLRFVDAEEGFFYLDKNELHAGSTSWLYSYLLHWRYCIKSNFLYEYECIWMHP